MPSNYKALTVRYNGLSRVIKYDVGISVPFTPPSKPPTIKTYQAIWDTGANCSVITSKVVQELNLQPINYTIASTGHGSGKAPVYLLNFFLPDNVVVMNINAVELKIKDADVLIGMDILNLGDFVITNSQKKTTMSFRIPSAYEIDFVEEVQISKLSRKDRRRLENEKRKRL